MTGEANAGKALTVELDGAAFSRIPIRTHVVMPGDDLDAFVRQYAEGVVRPGDLLFVTEKIVAITQGRSYLVEGNWGAGVYENKPSVTGIRTGHKARYRDAIGF